MERTARAHRRSVSRWLVPLLGLVLLATPPLTGPAVADPSDPAPPASVGELRGAVQDRTDQVDAARAELADASAAASAALEEYSTAVRAHQMAHAGQVKAEQALATADADLAGRRRELGRWARQAYYAGSGLAADPSLVTLLGGSTDDVAHSRRVLSALGTRREQAVSATEAAQTARQRAALVAEQATEQAVTLLRRAEQAHEARDTAVTALRATLDRQEAQLEQAKDAAGRAAAQALRLAQARAVAGRSAGGANGNVVTGPVGSCTGGQMELYPNGQIPIEALCPVWGASGQHLRADAAYAFNQLSTAYARQFGAPICVTDSYRSLAQQVAVKAAKPHLAATPGTSNHGWGTAVDLCGGVQSYDSVEHRWLFLNGPGFGWFLPSWAQRDGAKPEPWHWEFGG